MAEKEYIERDAAINFVKSNTPTVDSMTTIGCVERVLYNAPAADVQEVRHARWDNDGHCTNCGFHAPYRQQTSDYFKSPFCHICGAKMDGKGDA